MQKHKAFSLAEILICFTIIGIFYLILTPIMAKFSPNSSKVMFRKAYNTAEKTIYNMINDDSAYPNVDLGFADDTEVDGKNKFCYYYFNNLNTFNEIYSTNSCSAKTGDGISWNISNIEFKNSSTDEPLDSYNTTIKASLKDGESFEIKVRYDGKIKIESEELISILENPVTNN